MISESRAGTAIFGSGIFFF